MTYHRSAGRTSQSHIAIVADVIAPSGRPMIVHNRGWGPQLEDALFLGNITGHYRFSGAAGDNQTGLRSTTPAADGPAQTPLPQPNRERVTASSGG